MISISRTQMMNGGYTAAPVCRVLWPGAYMALGLDNRHAIALRAFDPIKNERTWFSDCSRDCCNGYRNDWMKMWQ